MFIEKQKECVVMLLAGGQGSRLKSLTKKIAKPAVPFGGKYRIIDFALSNCVNSSLDTIGVLTQYQPLVLNEYIGNGKPWDLDRLDGGINILPPYQSQDNSKWYQGTANAIYQNMDFLERYNPKYVLILSADHVYKMDYTKMLDFHKETKADVTISTIDVSLQEASRFGIVNTDKDNRINEFEEKPKYPKSTKASMGVYIFNYKKLKKYLEIDDKNLTSSKDFGKDVLPTMLKNDEKMYAYEFKGYWKDVGTINSLWQANMDLLNSKGLNSTDKFKIYSRHENYPPHFIAQTAKVTNSIITEGSTIYGKVENSIIFPGVTIKEHTEVQNSIIMPNVIIEKNSKINYSIIDEHSFIGENMIIDGSTKEEIIVVSRQSRITNDFMKKIEKKITGTVSA